MEFKDDSSASSASNKKPPKNPNIKPPKIPPQKPPKVVPNDNKNKKSKKEQSVDILQRYTDLLSSDQIDEAYEIYTAEENERYKDAFKKINNKLNVLFPEKDKPIVANYRNAVQNQNYVNALEIFEDNKNDKKYIDAFNNINDENGTDIGEIISQVLNVYSNYAADRDKIKAKEVYDKFIPMQGEFDQINNNLNFDFDEELNDNQIMLAYKSAYANNNINQMNKLKIKYPLYVQNFKDTENLVNDVIKEYALLVINNDNERMALWDTTEPSLINKFKEIKKNPFSQFKTEEEIVKLFDEANINNNSKLMNELKTNYPKYSEQFKAIKNLTDTAIKNYIEMNNANDTDGMESLERIYPSLRIRFNEIKLNKKIDKKPSSQPTNEEQLAFYQNYLDNDNYAEADKLYNKNLNLRPQFDIIDNNYTPKNPFVLNFYKKMLTMDPKHANEIYNSNRVIRRHLDKIKNDFAKLNNYHLLRIKFDQINKIEKILKVYESRIVQ